MTSECPDPSVHGNPFRYCPYCSWTEPLGDHGPDETCERCVIPKGHPVVDSFAELKQRPVTHAEVQSLASAICRMGPQR